MRRSRWLLPCLLALAACASTPPRGGEPPLAPAVAALYDHHMHIFSDAASSYLREAAGLKTLPSFTGKELDKVLTEDGVEGAALLSNAYFFSMPGDNSPEQTRKVQLENDWVASQAALYPDRLVALLSINPLADHALAEIARCAATRAFVGVKLHFANSKVDLRDPEHVKTLQRVFGRINDLRLPIVVHLRTLRLDYGGEDAQVFIREVLPAALDVPVQVAHAGGWGGYDPATDAALAAFADALATGAARHKALYFDLSAVVRGVGKAPKKKPGAEWWPEHRYQRLVDHLRRIGMRRILFGSDWPEWTPASYRNSMATELPLKRGELEAVLAQRAPWLKQGRR